MEMILVDHYDSFTNNVIDWLAGGAGEVQVHHVAWDDGTAMAEAERSALPLVLSPGPKSPKDLPATMQLLRRKLGQVPILGICLGHQMLAANSGAAIVRGRAPWHGTTRRIEVQADAGLLSGLAPAFNAGVYNSLVVAAGTLPASWTINAYCDQGEIQAMAYRQPGLAPAFGLQFHPESFLSEGAARIRQNWIQAASARPSSDVIARR